MRRLRALRDGSPLESYHTFSGLPQIGKFTGFRHTNNVSSDAGSKQGGDDDQEVNSTQVSVPVIGACCSSGGDSIYSRSTDDCGESSSSDLSNTHAASIAAAAAHAAALTSAAAAAVPLINIPHEFKNVPGIQEVVLDYEKKLLMEMQKILLSHYFKAIAENMNMNH